MFNYFVRFDSRVISVSQYSVRQVELYTPMTKFSVQLISIRVFEFASAVTSLLFVLSSPIQYPLTYLSIGVAIFLLTSLTARSYKDIIKQNKALTDSPPGEIVARRLCRAMGFLIFIFAISIISIFSESIVVDKSNWLWLIRNCSMACLLLLMLVCEYLLCTTSIDPNQKKPEKQKR